MAAQPLLPGREPQISSPVLPNKGCATPPVPPFLYDAWHRSVEAALLRCGSLLRGLPGRATDQMW